MPRPAVNAVASNTSNTLRADHSIIRLSMSMSLLMPTAIAGGWASHRRVDGLDAHDDIFARRPLDDLEVDLLAGFQRPQQCRIPGTEIHGHRRPVETGNRIMCNRYRRVCPIHRFNAADTKM